MNLDCRYLVITSDEHSPPNLDRGAWATKPEIRGDFERAATEVDAWCEEHQADGIVRVSTGDTLDSFEPHPDRLAWLAKYFDKHLTHCKAYLYIQGQHDRVTQCPEIPWLSVVVPNSKMVYAHKQVYNINDMTALFHDNTVPFKLMEYLNSKPVEGDSPVTLFCHQLWAPWLPAVRSSANLLDIPPYITWLISGDYHVPREEVFVTKYQHQLSAWSVGPLHIQDVSEPANCRFMVYDFQERKMLYIPLTCRPVKRFEITTKEQLEEFEVEMARMPIYHDDFSVNKPIVIFRYYTTVEQASNVATAVCRGRAHLFNDAVVPMQIPTAGAVYSRNDKHDVSSCLVGLGVTPGTPVHALIEAAMDAMSPGDLEARLNIIRTRFMEGKSFAN